MGGKPSTAAVPRASRSAPSPQTTTAKKIQKGKEELRYKVSVVYERLAILHPDAHIELKFSNPLELLVATILSAQCTDVRVNIVTEKLFPVFKTAEDYIRRPQSELESHIRSAGFYRQKAKSIRGAMKAILEEHSGKVPMSMEELTKLPGVGRKTANVLLGNAFDLPGFPVDTHVTRLTNRIGLTKQHDPVKIEQEICALIPEKQWTQFSHLLIFHGRRICKARSPACDRCSLPELCSFYKREVAPAVQRKGETSRGKRT